MALTIVYMIIFSIILAIRNIKNQYNLLFILMILGMSISMFTILSEIFKSSNYLISTIYLPNKIEYHLFLFISNFFRLTLSSLLILRNIGIIIYLIAIILFSINFNKSLTNNSSMSLSKNQIIKYIFLCFFPLLYYIFYHPNTAYYIYLKFHAISNEQYKTIWVLLTYILDSIFIVITLLYLVYPIILLIKNLKKNRIPFFTTQLLGLAICLTLLNLTFFSMFFIGTFKTSVTNVYNSGFWRYKLSTFVPKYYTVIIPMLSIITLLIILSIIVKFKTDRMINGLKERSLQKNLHKLNANVKDVLHSNKNVMFNLKILAEGALTNYGTEEGQAQLQRILTLSTGSMDSIARTLDNIKELKFRTMNNNLIDAVENALESVAIPNHITIVKDYYESNVTCKYDMFHITQAIINLLTNAIDAINSVHSLSMVSGPENPNNKEGTITITIDSTFDWVYLAVTDDGCGIPRKLKKKIFLPYFSTKSKQNNWGIGLSYVFRVVTHHYGHLRLKSIPEKHTTVEILLPKSN